MRIFTAILLLNCVQDEWSVGTDQMLSMNNRKELVSIVLRLWFVFVFMFSLLVGGAICDGFDGRRLIPNV